MLLEQGVELEQYLTRCQSIPPVIFRIRQYALLSPNLDQFMPILQERSKHETKTYCELMVILITKAHATGGGVATIFD